MPSQPSIEAPAPKAAPREDKRTEDKRTEDKRPDAAAPKAEQAGPGKDENPQSPAHKASSEPSIDREVDVLITMMQPFRYEGLDMDMPQLFAVLRYDAATPLKDGVEQPERQDLLGDVEEIRYLNRKAWGANVALTKPGLYQFAIEARPWWDAQNERFLRHFVKAILPVHGVEHGWRLPVGQRFEIVPLTRPFGLTLPAFFSGTALLDGKPLAQASVRMMRINMEKRPAPTPWHEDLAARTNAQGEFAFVLSQPGWWCCEAQAQDAPLKGSDGQPKPVRMSALLWLYVDSPVEPPKKR